MSLSLGIVGLPNIGKSTLFNALLKRQVALAANYPFATIEPNIGVVDVPDENLVVLADIVNKEYAKPTDTKQIPERIVPAVVKFYDIAGLVKGASEGEGLGNKFLSHIREVDAILHLVRDFDDANIVREGSTDPKTDIEIINTELILSDLATLQARLSKHESILKREKTKDNIRKMELYEMLNKTLNEGKLPSTLNLTPEDLMLVRDLNLLTIKPMLYVYNTDESKIASYLKNSDSEKGSRLYICAKMEAELSVLSKQEQQEYLRELGISESGLDKVIKLGYSQLGLQPFYTAGPMEVRAWTIKTGTKAPEAAGTIHTDFEKGFIKAKVVSFDKLVACGGFRGAKEGGHMRLEGKDYVMQLGDVVEFMFNN